MKKLLAVAVICLMLLSGCGNEEAKKDNITKANTGFDYSVPTDNKKDATEGSTEAATEPYEPLVEKKGHIDRFEVYSEYNLEELMQYDSVRYLKIDNAKLKDYSFLKDIKVQLLHVIARTHYINDVIPVDFQYLNTDYIEEICLQNCIPKNGEVLKNASKLEYFIIEQSWDYLETDLDFLKGCYSLKSITANNCNLKNLNFVEGMKDLCNLAVSESIVSDLSILKGCTSLENLEITSSRVKDLTPLENLDNLYFVNFTDNYISDISPLRKPLETNLCYIYLGENFVTDLSVFDGVEGYDSVILEKNYITELPEYMLTNGHIIDFAHNNIAHIPESTLEKLENSGCLINMFDNLLSDEDVERLGDMQTVYFEDNGYGTLDAAAVVAFNKKMREVLEKCNKGDEKEKVFRVAKYVSNECTIDYEGTAEYKDSAYSAFFDKVLCVGVTNITDALLRHLNIRTKTYHGDTDSLYDDVAHVWNVVEIDGEAYHCDNTYSVTYKDENLNPKLVMLSDYEIREYGHIVEKRNIKACPVGVSEYERKQIWEKIKE